MKIVIRNKLKKDLFVALFQTIKNCSSVVNIIFQMERIHIQGMDKSHICMFDLSLLNKWFDEYDVSQETNISFNTGIFHTILNSKQDSNDIIIQKDHVDGSEETISIELISQEHSKGEFNKYFKVPLVDYEYELMTIPPVEYDAEFTIASKKICEIVTQMTVFGNDIQIQCSEEKMDLVTSGITGEMKVNIPIEDLTEFSIVEGAQIILNYSLSYICKMCLTNKLSSEIYFYISENSPMKIKYDLGCESYLEFYIAPKIKDGE
jgi:proliferating cell nuclear antigen PCNA